MLYNFEGFETVGTEIGIANQGTTAPRIVLRCDESARGGVPATDSFFLIDDKDSEGYAIQMGSNNFSNGNFIAWNIPVADQGAGAPGKTFIVGVRLHVPSTTRTYSFLGVRSDANNDTHIFWRIVDSTDLQCWLNVVGQIDIATDVFTPGSWHYVEMKFKIANAPFGLVEAYVDGNLAFSDSSIDTLNFWATVDQFRFLNTVSASGEDYTGYDDIYMLKTEGDDPVDYLSASVSVVSLPPDADDTVEWTTSAGSDHYALVDENGADPSDYVETNVDTEEEMFTITDLSVAGDYYGVKVEVEAIDTDVGANNMDVRIDSGGTIDETNYNVTDTVNYAVFIYIVGADDPDTSSAWTTSAINALKIGAQFNT